MMDKSWTTFWLGTVVAIIIAIGAGKVLQNFEISSKQKYSTSSTRL